VKKENLITFLIGLLGIFSITFSITGHALEIDEKLTLRVLSVSESKKTLLINRGLEDGLVVDDHAKFFLTTGVIARGIVIKASPTRSIWSVYRLVAPDQIEKDKVLNLKITSSIKLTKDPSRILNPKSFFASPTRRLLDHYNGIPFEEYGYDAPRGINIASPTKAVDLMLPKEREQYGKRGGLHLHKTIEFFGTIHFNGLSTTTTQEDVETFTGKQAFSDITVGFEKYFRKVDHIFHRFSFQAFFHRSSAEIVDLDADAITQTVLEYGVGLNWHWGNDPLSFGRLIGYWTVTGGFGTATDEVSISRTSLNTTDNFEGASNFITLGLGAKYYTAFGFGARVLLDYYRRSETYEVVDSNDFSRTVSGPRLQVGLSYRW